MTGAVPAVNQYSSCQDAIDPVSISVALPSIQLVLMLLARPVERAQNLRLTSEQLVCKCMRAL